MIDMALSSLANAGHEAEDSQAVLPVRHSPAQFRAT